jgi:hypothetical protein
LRYYLTAGKGRLLPLVPLWGEPGQRRSRRLLLVLSLLPMALRLQRQKSRVGARGRMSI